METASHRRCRGARDARRGRRADLEGARGRVRGTRRRRHPLGDRAPPDLREARAPRGEASRAEGAPAEGPQGLPPRRDERAEDRRAGDRLGPRRLRPRRPHSGHALCRSRPLSGPRRQARPFRPREGAGGPGCGEGRRGLDWCRRRRPGQLRGVLRAGRPRRRLGRGRQRDADDGRARPAPRRPVHLAPRGAPHPQAGRRGRGPRGGADANGRDLSRRLPGPRLGRAAELHGEGRERAVRDLGADTEPAPGPEGVRGAPEDRSREGHGPRDAPRRGVRAAPPRRLRDRGGRGRARREGPRPGRLVPRGRFPRRLPSSDGARGPRSRDRRIGEDHRVESPLHVLPPFDVRRPRSGRQRYGRRPVGRVRHALRDREHLRRVHRGRVSRPHGGVAGRLLPAERLRARVLPRRGRCAAGAGPARPAAGAPRGRACPDASQRPLEDRPAAPRGRA